MTDDLYEFIIEQASSLPGLGIFIPMLTGEPLCDPKFIKRLKYARENLSAVIEVYTNGSFLTKEIIDELKDISELYLNVSINGTTPETRKLLTGLDDFNKVMESIKYLGSVGIPHRASIVSYPGISIDELNLIYKTKNKIIPYQSWCSGEYTRITKEPCGRAENYMTVRYNGDVCLCCFDPFGRITFGNLNNQTIEEVWNSDKHKEYQEMHKQGRAAELKLCKHCTNL